MSARYNRRDIMFPGCPSVHPSFCPSVLAQFSLNNVHKRGLKHHHFIFVRQSHFTGTTLCVTLNKSYDISTNYRACIAMSTWCRCAPPILFWPWPLFNLFPRSCLTWIFLIDYHWGVPLCVQRPAKAMTFQQIIVHVWQCPHDVDVYLLFCFDLNLHLTCFCFIYVHQHA